MSEPYIKEDVFGPSHICLVCRQILTALEIVEKIDADRYVHLRCGGVVNPLINLESQVKILEEEVRKQVDQGNTIHRLRRKVKILRAKVKLYKGQRDEIRSQFERLFNGVAKREPKEEQVNVQLMESTAKPRKLKVKRKK